MKAAPSDPGRPALVPKVTRWLLRFLLLMRISYQPSAAVVGKDSWTCKGAASVFVGGESIFHSGFSETRESTGRVQYSQLTMFCEFWDIL